jgi:hypothetical protein
VLALFSWGDRKDGFRRIPAKTLPVPTEERAKLLANAEESAEQSLKCWHGIWSGSWAVPQNVRAYLQIDRSQGCFYYRHRPGMGFEAAVELERTHAEERRLRQDRRLVKWSIVCGIVGTMLGAVLDRLLLVVFR